MNIVNLFSLKDLKTFRFWLAVIGIGVGAIHLSIAWRLENLSFFGLSILFWCAVGSLLWDKRNSLCLKSGVFASFLGGTLLALLLLKSAFLPKGSGMFLLLFPIVASFSLAILASGFKGLRQYWREILILSTLGGIQLFVSMLTDFDPSLLTAKFATYVLWYLGFAVTGEDSNIYFSSSSNSVEVYPGCSGLESMLHLLSLSLLFFMMFPTRWLAKIILPIIAIILGFVSNGIRVALMAIFIARGNQISFEYWHEGEGSLLFSLITVVGFCGIAFLMVKKEITAKSLLPKGDQ